MLELEDPNNLAELDLKIKLLKVNFLKKSMFVELDELDNYLKVGDKNSIIKLVNYYDYML